MLPGSAQSAGSAKWSFAPERASLAQGGDMKGMPMGKSQDMSTMKGMPESAKLGKSNKVRQSNLHFSKDSVVPEGRSETRDGRCRPAGKPGIGGIWAPSELSTFIKESYP